MNTPTLAGDELALHVAALDRKIDTLSSQLRSLLERAPQGPPAPLPPTTTCASLIGRTTGETMATGLPESSNVAGPGSIPVETGSTDSRTAMIWGTYEQIKDRPRPIPKDEEVARTRLWEEVKQ